MRQRAKNYDPKAIEMKMIWNSKIQLLTLFYYQGCNPVISNNEFLYEDYLQILSSIWLSVSRLFGCCSGCTFCLILPLADVTVLLSLTVFMNLVSAIMPTTSDAVPLIGKRAMTSVHHWDDIIVIYEKALHSVFSLPIPCFCMLMPKTIHYYLSHFLMLMRYGSKVLIFDSLKSLLKLLSLQFL